MTLSLTRRVVAVLVPANVQHIRWPLCLPASTCSRPPCAGGKARQQGFQCRDRDDRQLPFVTSTRDDSVRVDSTRPASPCVLSASRSRSRQRRWTSVESRCPAHLHDWAARVWIRQKKKEDRKKKNKKRTRRHAQYRSAQSVQPGCVYLSRRRWDIRAHSLMRRPGGQLLSVRVRR